jgi:hypothetical protein
VDDPTLVGFFFFGGGGDIAVPMFCMGRCIVMMQNALVQPKIWSLSVNVLLYIVQNQVGGLLLAKKFVMTIYLKSKQ